MMISEFTERTGYKPSSEEYKYIEESYYEFDGNKDEFCRWFNKAQTSGEWKTELRLRRKIAYMEETHKAEMNDKEDNLEFYRAVFQRSQVAERILLAIGKDELSEIVIKCVDEPAWRSYHVKVKYVDSGINRYINVIAGNGFITSFNIECIQSIIIK